MVWWGKNTRKDDEEDEFAGHDRVRFQAALEVSIRTNSVIGAAMEYNLYQNHVQQQLEVKRAQEAALEADVEHRQKSRLTSQDSIARRVAKVSLDEAKWRRHQMLSGKNLLTATPGGHQSSRLGKASFSGAHPNGTTNPSARQSSTNLGIQDDAFGTAQQQQVKGSRLSALLAQYDSQAGGGGGQEEENGEDEDWLDRRDRSGSMSGHKGERGEGGRSNKSSMKWNPFTANKDSFRKNSSNLAAATSFARPSLKVPGGAAASAAPSMRMKGAVTDDDSWISKTKDMLSSLMGKFGGGGGSTPQPILEKRSAPHKQQQDLSMANQHPSPFSGTRAGWQQEAGKHDPQLASKNSQSTPKDDLSSHHPPTYSGGGGGGGGGNRDLLAAAGGLAERHALLKGKPGPLSSGAPLVAAPPLKQDHMADPSTTCGSSNTDAVPSASTSSKEAVPTSTGSDPHLGTALVIHASPRTAARAAQNSSTHTGVPQQYASPRRSVTSGVLDVLAPLLGGSPRVPAYSIAGGAVNSTSLPPPTAAGTGVSQAGSLQTPLPPVVTTAWQQADAGVPVGTSVGTPSITTATSSTSAAVAAAVAPAVTPKHPPSQLSAAAATLSSTAAPATGSGAAASTSASSASTAQTTPLHASQGRIVAPRLSQTPEAAPSGSEAALSTLVPALSEPNLSTILASSVATPAKANAQTQNMGGTLFKEDKKNEQAGTTAGTTQGIRGQQSSAAAPALVAGSSATGAGSKSTLNTAPPISGSSAAGAGAVSPPSQAGQPIPAGALAGSFSNLMKATTSGTHACKAVPAGPASAPAAAAGTVACSSSSSSSSAAAAAAGLSSSIRPGPMPGQATRGNGKLPTQGPSSGPAAFTHLGKAGTHLPSITKGAANGASGRLNAASPAPGVASSAGAAAAGTDGRTHHGVAGGGALQQSGTTSKAVQGRGEAPSVLPSRTKPEPVVPALKLPQLRGSKR